LRHRAGDGPGSKLWRAGMAVASARETSEITNALGKLAEIGTEETVNTGKFILLGLIMTETKEWWRNLNDLPRMEIELSLWLSMVPANLCTVACTSELMLCVHGCQLNLVHM